MTKVLLKHLLSHKVIILLLAASLCLRLYTLGTNPAVLNRDEAALGYNAYLLQTTGVDEWNVSWPIALQSFGDYKLPGYPLLLVFLFSIFNPTDFMVRLPAALAGVVLTLLSYLISRRLGSSKLAAMGVLISVGLGGPIFFYSRMAYEALVSLTFLVGILWLFLSVEKLRLKHYVLLTILAASAVFTYNTPLAYLGLLSVLLPPYYGFKQIKSWVIPSFILLLVVTASALILSKVISQKSGITIFSDELVRTEQIESYQSATGLAARIQASNVVFYSERIVRQYFGHFTYYFLVSRGGSHPWHSLPGKGHFEPIFFVLSFVGMAIITIKSTCALYYKLRRGRDISPIDQKWLFFLGWLLMAPLPASITVDAPHATRSLLFLFLLQICIGPAIDGIRRLGTAKVRQAMQATLFASMFFSSVVYLYNYFVIYPKTQRINFQESFKSSVVLAKNLYPDQKIAVVDGGGYNYILAAWYTKMDPKEFLSSVVRQQPDRIGFRYGERVGLFHFIAAEEDSSPEEEIIILQRERESDTWMVRKK